MPIWSQLIHKLSVLSQPRKNRFTAASVYSFYSFLNGWDIVRRITTVTIVFVSMETVYRPNFNLGKKILIYYSRSKFTREIMNEQIDIFVYMYYFFDALNLIVVIFRFHHMSHRYYASSSRVTNNEPAVRVWLWFYIALRRTAGSFLWRVISPHFH